MILDKIRKSIQNGSIFWQKHALQRILERDIARAEVKQAILLQPIFQMTGVSKKTFLPGEIMENNNRCPICNGYKSESTTTFTVDLDFGVIVVRHVPAEVCEQCGSEWIDDNSAEQLDQIVNYAKEKHTMIEVSEFATWKKAAS